jgi:hypothetical protein
MIGQFPAERFGQVTGKSGRTLGFPVNSRRLLDDVRQFVRDESPAARRIGLIHTVRERDAIADCPGRCRYSVG